MKKHKRQNYSPWEQNTMNAVTYAWTASLEVMMLILYERADYTADGLRDFGELYKDYIDAICADEKSVRELEREFEDATGLHLDEAFKEEPNGVRQAIRTAKVLAIKIGGLILWKVAEWDKKAVREFVYACWDEIPHHADLVPRIRQMQKETKVYIGFNR